MTTCTWWDRCILPPEVDPDDFDEEIAPGRGPPAGRGGGSPRPGNSRTARSTHGGWASLYDVSPDWQPVIGEVAPGVFVDAGTSGHGFKLAPALGKHVADLVVGSSELDPRLTEFDPFRFTRGSALRAGFRDARILG